MQMKKEKFQKIIVKFFFYILFDILFKIGLNLRWVAKQQLQHLSVEENQIRNPKRKT